MSIEKLAPLRELRYVVDLLDVFLPEDHNDHVYNWRVQLGFDRWVIEVVGESTPELDDLIAKLDSVVAEMREVAEGDAYLTRDHNLFVEAWSLQKDINELLRDLLKKKGWL